MASIHQIHPVVKTATSSFFSRISRAKKRKAEDAIDDDQFEIVREEQTEQTIQHSDKKRKTESTGEDESTYTNHEEKRISASDGGDNVPETTSIAGEETLGSTPYEHEEHITHEDDDTLAGYTDYRDGRLLNSSMQSSAAAETRNDLMEVYRRPANLASKRSNVPERIPQYYSINQTRPLPHLLALPANLRTEILRLSIIDKDRTIEVSKTYPHESKEPLIAEVCQAFRAEALPLYYQNNPFVVQVKDYKIVAVLPWLKYAEQKAGTGADYIRSIVIETDGVPHWINLQTWLQLAHEGKAPPLCEGVLDHGGRDAAVKAVFATIMALQEDSWMSVQRILPAQRHMMAVGNQGWKLDQEAKVPTREVSSAAMLDHEKQDGSDTALAGLITAISNYGDSELDVGNATPSAQLIGAEQKSEPVEIGERETTATPSAQLAVVDLTAGPIDGRDEESAVGRSKASEFLRKRKESRNQRMRADKEKTSEVRAFGRTMPGGTGLFDDHDE